MITPEEMEKINIALRKSKKIDIIWSAVVLGLGVFFTYYLFQFFPQLLPTMGILTALSLVFISLYGFLLNTHAKISIFPKDEGLEIPKSKKDYLI
ncbi:MAG: hypothetical protein GXO25_03220 [Euryarchaeota archaeon]|nr:hypothetical protein [Euryarchaeota archaeon]